MRVELVAPNEQQRIRRGRSTDIDRLAVRTQVLMETMDSIMAEHQEKQRMLHSRPISNPDLNSSSIRITSPQIVNAPTLSSMPFIAAPSSKTSSKYQSDFFCKMFSQGLSLPSSSTDRSRSVVRKSLTIYEPTDELSCLTRQTCDSRLSTPISEYSFDIRNRKASSSGLSSFTRHHLSHEKHELLPSFASGRVSKMKSRLATPIRKLRVYRGNINNLRDTFHGRITNYILDCFKNS